MESPCRIADAPAAHLRYLGRLNLCRIESGQGDVGATVDPAERNRVDIAEYRVVLIDNGKVAEVDSVVNGEVDLVPHRNIHSEGQPIRLVLVAVRT